MKLTRRHLQITLGLLWLADGLLQLQPFMFSTGFAHQILAPAGDGQPGWVAGPVRYFADHFAQHPILLNSAAAAFQLALGAGFLLRRTTRLAVIASIAWSVGIWWFGEGLGGVASAHATLITGAPGAAILYGLLAVASWTPHRGGHTGRRDMPGRWLPWGWATLWVGGAVLQMLPAQNNPIALADQIHGGADGAPAWIAATDHAAADLIARASTGGLVSVAIVMAAIGLSALTKGHARTVAAYAGAGLAAVFWLVGQNLGQLYTGQATDPNSAVLLIVFAAALAGSAPAVVAAAAGRPAAQARPRPEAATHASGSRRPVPVHT